MNLEKKSTMNSNLMELPILKHFNQNEISTNIDSFRKGEFKAFQIIKLLTIATLIYFTYTLVLPLLFQKIGQMLALVATGVILVASVILFPVLVKALRVLTRQLHKLLISYDPFQQLEIEKLKMLDNQQTFRISKGKIESLKNDMEIESAKSENDADELQNKILTLRGKAEKIKNDMDEMVRKLGISAKSEDQYVNYSSQLQKILAESQRVSNKLTQSKDFVQKYGSRAAIMKKMSQKLTMVETAMDIKILDFDATIDMLKKDYDFGQKANEATTAAKSAMLFNKGFEFDYALEVVTNTISRDIQITSGNLKDIDSLTNQYSIDSDELYTNLNQIADKIKIGEDIVPNSKQYSNSDYVLTQSDKLKSGGFQDLF